MKKLAVAAILAVAALATWLLWPADSLSASGHFTRGEAGFENDEDSAWRHFHAVSYDESATPRQRHQALHRLIQHSLRRNFRINALGALRRLEEEALEDIDYRYHMTVAWDAVWFGHAELAISALTRGQQVFPEGREILADLLTEIRRHQERIDDSHPVVDHACLGLGYLGGCIHPPTLSRVRSESPLAPHLREDFDEPLDCQH